MNSPILCLSDLKVHFFTFRGVARAIDGISLEVYRGEALGLVGESGSGKSVTGLAVLQLIQPPGRIVSGDIAYQGESLLHLPEKRLRTLRGGQISMIFQNPRTCLNPVLTIGEQIDRVYRTHTGATAKATSERRSEMLRRVGIGEPERFSRNYPHQVSGGMAQRAMIVMALICNPDLIVADEPTTGLDVTIQRQIMDLLGEMRRELSATQVLITHDLGVVAETCDRIAVLYAGRMMEVATTHSIFMEPRHPYTIGLLHSIPRVDVDDDPIPLPGYVPNAYSRPSGCPFHPRCQFSEPICRQEEPPMCRISVDHQAACHCLEKVRAYA
jgi:peptide/nickel transport system ATP-binding protein/oligopeptide transport system ATP-binding protein